MFTPAERRGALVVALLFALGAARDLWRASHPAITPAPEVDVAGAADPDPGTAPPPAGLPAAGSADTTGAVPIDLNRAGPAELDALPGIGPVLARRIVEHRAAHGPFRAVDELLAVRGIGPKLFARLKPRVTVGEPGVSRTRQGRIVRPRASPP